jgi:hypothetical protein
MRYVRAEVDEITGTYFRCKFEPLCPTDLATTFHDIDSNLVTAMVMSSSLRIRLEGDCANPSSSSPGTGEIKCGRTSCSRRSTHGRV